MKDYVGHIALAALLISLFLWLRSDVADLRGDVHAQISGLRSDVHAQISELRGEMNAQFREHSAQISDLQQRMARVEVLIAGLAPGIAAVRSGDPETPAAAAEPPS